MNGLSKRLATAVVSAAVVLTSFVPSQAIQMPAAPQMEISSDMQNVGYRDRDEYRDRDRSEYRRRHYRRYDDDRRYRSYHSHRRERYRERYVYPLAAFGAGAIIGSAIASQQQPQSYSGSNNHVSWCGGRYRSYRAYDNTFQPHNGPRQQCYSPYN